MANSAIQGSTLIDFPAGMIMPFAGTTTPAGWLECDGSEVDINKYPTLAATLGVTWNTAKNPLTGVNHAAPAAGKFRVPDMRGSFLRGSSQGSNNAQGVSTALAEFQEQKTRKNGLSATAADSSISALTLNASSLSSGTCAINKNAFNSNQNTHQHSVGYGANVYGGASTNPQFAGGPSSPATSVSSVSWASANANGSAAGTANAQSLNSGTAAAQAITVGDGDAETRPDAVGVRYLIKY